MPDGYAEFEDRMSDLGVDGRLWVGTDVVGLSPGADPASVDSASGGAALAAYDRDDWPPCRCGSAVCPDYAAPPPPPAERLRSDVAEVNRRSSRGGV
jgi:hypothetical protein